MSLNPYVSPELSETAPHAPNTRWRAFRRGVLRGGLLGGSIGLVCGGAVLLMLGLCVRTPMLTQHGPLAAVEVSTIFMGLAIGLPALVGAFGFGIRTLSSRAGNTVSETSDPQPVRVETAFGQDSTNSGSDGVISAT